MNFNFLKIIFFNSGTENSLIECSTFSYTDSSTCGANNCVSFLCYYDGYSEEDDGTLRLK